MERDVTPVSLSTSIYALETTSRMHLETEHPTGQSDTTVGELVACSSIACKDNLLKLLSGLRVRINNLEKYVSDSLVTQTPPQGSNHQGINGLWTVAIWDRLTNAISYKFPDVLGWANAQSQSTELSLGHEKLDAKISAATSKISPAWFKNSDLSSNKLRNVLKDVADWPQVLKAWSESEDELTMQTLEDAASRDPVVVNALTRLYKANKDNTAYHNLHLAALALNFLSSSPLGYDADAWK